MKIEFVPRDKQHSEYDWADFSNGEERIGKARCKIENDTITICSINIYPEWEGNGYGRDFVNYCKHHFQVVVADRVRPTAIGFWETMGFCNNQDGAWIFRKNTLLGILAMIWILLSVSITEAEHPPEILILNSYHQGEDWSDNELAGIISSFKKVYPFIVPSMEHLDTKRFPGPDHLLFIQRYLKNKYRERRFNLVFVLDNPALDMTIGCRQELFPGVPVVFAGINGYSPEMIREQELIAGVAEVQDIAGTLELALTLHPGTRSVLVVHDYTSSGIAVQKDMASVADQFQGKIRIHYTPEGTVDELVMQLRTLPADALVLLLTYVTDKAGRTLTREESTHLISNASPAPVYAMHETRMGHGIIGGMLLEGREHGRQAAEIALRILSRQDTAVYAVENSRSRPVFDYQQLVRFNISLKNLPENSLLFNQPISFFQRHRVLLIPGVIVTVFLLTIIAILCLSIVRIRNAGNALKKSEESLRESQEKYKRFVETANEGIWAMDANYRTTFVNRRMTEMLGYPTEEMIGKPVASFMFDEDMIDHQTKMEKRKQGHGGTYERRFRCKDGREVWTQVSATAITDATGLFAGSHALFTDMTEHKRMVDKLRENEARFRGYFDLGLIGMAITSPEKGWVECNDCLCSMLGYSRKELFEMTWQELTHPDDLAADVYQFDRVVNGEIDAYRIEKRFIHKDGSVIFTEISVRAVRRSDGWLDHFLAMIQDITERKLAEEGKIRLEAQLRQAQKMEAIGSLAGGIAHDLNNILFPISGLSEMLLDDIPPDSPMRAGIAQIHKSAKRGGDLVKQILAFSRQSNPQKLPIRIQPILKEALKLAQATIPRKIEITSHITADCGMVLADPTQIHQIMMNLITNAYHAVEKNSGTILVELKETTTMSFDEKEALTFQSIPSGRYGCITVSDTGTGIDPALIHRIFEPYFTTKEQGKGTGLGLSVVHGIIKQYGGDIRVYSEIGKGTTFHVYLPLIDDTGDIKPVAIDKHPSGSESILLVDDEEPIIHLEQMALERLGYRITARTSSIDALNAFRADPDRFDLVISDRGMPNMTGDQLAGELLSIRPEIPIILCTGFSTENDEQRARTMGIKGFLMKPVATGDLADMVRKVLDEAVSGASRQPVKPDGEGLR